MQGLIWTCCSLKVNMPIPIGRCHWILGERKVPLLHPFINNRQAWLRWVSSHSKQQCARWKWSCDTSCYLKYGTTICCSDEWYVMPTREVDQFCLIITHFLPSYRWWRWRLRSYFSSQNSLHLSLLLISALFAYSSLHWMVHSEWVYDWAHTTQWGWKRLNLCFFNQDSIPTSERASGNSHGIWNWGSQIPWKYGSAECNHSLSTWKPLGW